MGSQTLFSLFSLFLVLAFSVCHGALTFQEYWDLMLPNTPMPAAVRDHLGEPAVGTVTGVDGKPVEVDLGAKPIYPFYGRYHDTGDAGTVTGLDGNPNSLYFRKLSFGTSTRPNHHNPVVTQSDRVDHPKAPSFFLERDLHVGAQMNASFDRGLTGDRFLHREVAETIPFSSKELRDILRRFAVQPGSALANKLESTIRGCEMPPTPSKKKLCATSLESMVEFVISTLGTKDLQTLTTAIREDAGTQVYTVRSWTVVPTTPNWTATACHALKYPYTVFNCHGIAQTKPYVLKMVGEDGTPVDAVVLCHLDTSDWSPTFYVLQLLKVRPGEATVCHLILDGDVVWFPRSAIQTAHTAM